MLPVVDVDELDVSEPCSGCVCPEWFDELMLCVPDSPTVRLAGSSSSDAISRGGQ